MSTVKRQLLDQMFNLQFNFQQFQDTDKSQL